MPIRAESLDRKELQGTDRSRCECVIISSCFRQPKNLENALGQGLQDKIQLVAIDLQDKPAWYSFTLAPSTAMLANPSICWLNCY
jgi:hypothetical protein